VPGRASVIKSDGEGKDGAPIVWIGGSPSGLLVCLPVIFILHQKIQKMAKCTFWYQLTRVVLDKVQRAVKWLCVSGIVTGSQSGSCSAVRCCHVQEKHQASYQGISTVMMLMCTTCSD